MSVRIALFMLALAQPFSVLAQEGPSQLEYIRVTAPGAEIFAESDLSSDVVITAREGEIFAVQSIEGDWYAVTLWGDRTLASDLRYLHRSAAEQIERPEFSLSLETREELCGDLVEAFGDAQDESPTPRQRDLLAQLKRVSILREYGISPAISQKYLACWQFGTSNVVSAFLAVLAFAAPAIVLGLVIVLAGLRRNDPRVDGRIVIDWGDFWLAVLYGTMGSAVVIVLGAGVFYALIPGAIGGTAMFAPLFITIGMLVLGSYVIALRMVRRQRSGGSSQIPS